jgi:DNA (cytosine-5)-methyltransferase 1
MAKRSNSTNSQHKLTAVDLFAGCGGLTEGLKQAGFNVVGAVEIDELAANVYEANHPDVEKVWKRDIRWLTAKEAMKFLKLMPGELDLLAGCPPCQGFSTMRTLNRASAVEDERNDLVSQFTKFVKAFEPKAVMMENVPGLANDERFRTLVAKLERLGYKGDHRVLNVAEYGVPQRRKRLIYLAIRQGNVRFAYRARKKRTVRQALEALGKAGSSGDPLHDFPEHRSDRIKEMIALIPKDGGSRSDLDEKYRLECHKRCDGFKDVYGRMKWDDVAPTITSGCFNPSKGRFLHPEEDRAITMREAALLQSFPPTYQFPDATNKATIALMIGNALPPEFVRRQALAISRVLR